MAFPVLLKSLSLVPLGVQYRIADGFSFLLPLIPNRLVKLIHQNIELCFPNMDKAAKKELVRQSLKHSSYSAFELAAVWCWPPERILASISSQAVCDSFDQSSKSRIVIAPHLGSWELLNIWLAQRTDLMSLYKPQGNPSSEQFILNARSRNGAQMLSIDSSGLRQLSRGLKQGRTAMILPDHRPKRRKTRCLSKFFGHDAQTSTLIHSLCSRNDCDVFIATIFRDQQSAQFSVLIEELDHSRLAADQQSSLDYMNSCIESLIKQKPEQYQWGYGRFKPSTYQNLT